MSGVISPRAVTVFLSCPGDLARAKDELTAVVHAVANHFRPHGIYLAPWRYDPQAVPGVGMDAQEVVSRQMPDYDIYVGLLCGRVGTPTRRALSGTLEEFGDAKERFLDSGRPQILFYFCAEEPAAANAEDEKQLLQVREFRRHFPGLFATFQNVDELGALFRGHLIDLVLCELTPGPPRPRAWAGRMAEAVDLAVKAPGYLDRSARSVSRLLQKLHGLFDLPAVLNSDESDTFIAAAYLRAFARAAVDAAAARSILRNVAGQADWLEKASLEVATLAEVPPATAEEGVKLGNVRCSFLAALLQLGEILDSDHDALAARPESPPPEDADLSFWLAYCTRHLGVQRPGLVLFQVVVARTQKSYRHRISRCIALIFEAKWQALRPILAANGIALSRAPIDLALSPTVTPMPLSVLSRLETAAAHALTEIPKLLHLGDEPPALTTVDALLPLPCSAVLNELTLTFDPERDCVLRLICPKGELAVVRPVAAGRLRVPADVLAAGDGVCQWQLVVDEADFVSVIASGQVWVVSPSDQIRLEAAIDGSHPSAIRSWRFALGLWNDVLSELWPKLISGQGDRTEALLVRDVLFGSYDWLRRHSPGSGQLDRIRNAANWVHTTFLEDTQPLCEIGVLE
jgi:hypothetical protein